MVSDGTVFVGWILLIEEVMYNPATFSNNEVVFENDEAVLSVITLGLAFSCQGYTLIN